MFGITGVVFDQQKTLAVIAAAVAGILIFLYLSLLLLGI